MAERTERSQADRRAAFLDQLKKSGVVNLDASLSSLQDATAALPGGSTNLTIAFDDEKWYAIHP